MTNMLLTILSDTEQFALYGLPDFDDRQRLTYLSLSGPELALASSRPGLHAQVRCALQIGYFNVKHAFFRFTWDDAQEDCTFVLVRYFKDQLFRSQIITKNEHYVQRTMIAELFGYRREPVANYWCINHPASLIGTSPRPNLQFSNRAVEDLKRFVHFWASPKSLSLCGLV